jgi:hypothetical protein
VVFATPTGPNAGLKNYCATADGVVRFVAVVAPPTAPFATTAACLALPPL